MTITVTDITRSASRLDENMRRHFGPAVLAALADPRTTDLLLKPDGIRWQARLGEPMQAIGRSSAAQAEMAPRTHAAALHTTITAEKPWFEGVLPLDGSRIARQTPPVVTAPGPAGDNQNSGYRP